MNDKRSLVGRAIGKSGHPGRITLGENRAKAKG
jgi:hypothetical protein